MPGDDPLALDAVAFPVPAAPDGEETADTRFLLNPRMLDAPGAARARLIRHELTHVAIGKRADGVPTWLSEGIAEYVSVRPLAPEDRVLSRAALAAAEDGVTDLPADDDVQRLLVRGQLRHRLVGVRVPRRGLRRGDALVPARVDARRRRSRRGAADGLQLTPEELARKAGRLMLQTYDAPSPEGGSPSGSSTD